MRKVVSRLIRGDLNEDQEEEELHRYLRGPETVVVVVFVVIARLAL